MEARRAFGRSLGMPRALALPVLLLLLAQLSSREAAAVDAGPAALVRGPYVQSVTGSSAVVVWRTAAPSAGRVRWGPSPDALTQVAVSSGPATQHEIRLHGLSPGTATYYEIGDGEGPLADVARLSTAPPPSAPVRAWVLGDSGTGTQTQLDVRDAALRVMGPRPPDVLLHVGDIAYTAGTDAQLQTRFFDVYAATLRSTPTMPAFGNHEGHSSTPATQTGPWFDAFVLPAQGEGGGVPSGTEAYYSFDVGDVHFVVLDSHGSSRAPDGPMLTWLRQDLEATDRRWIVASWHHAPYSKGGHDSDLELPMIEMRMHAVPILEEMGVDLVLTGHSHGYERSFLLDGAYGTPADPSSHVVDGGSGSALAGEPYVKPAIRTPNAGAVYVVAGHGGSTSGGTNDHPLMASTKIAPGSCVLDVDRDVLQLRNYRRDGVLLDEVTIVKGDALVVLAPEAGDEIAPGAPVEIRWMSVGAPSSSVRVEYSADGGRRFVEIAAAAPDTGAFLWTPPPLGAERVHVRVTSNDEPGRYDVSDAFVLQADGPNEPPVVAPLPATTAVVGEALELRIDAADPEGAPVFFVGTALPEGSALDELTGVLRWTPTLDDAGEHALSLRVEDVVGAFTPLAVTVEVEAPAASDAGEADAPEDAPSRGEPPDVDRTDGAPPPPRGASPEPPPEPVEVPPAPTAPSTPRDGGGGCAAGPSEGARGAPALFALLLGGLACASRRRRAREGRGRAGR